MAGGKSYRLEGGLHLGRRLQMGKPRIEVMGALTHTIPTYKAMGMFTEMVTYQMRLFIPTGAEGQATLERLLEKHPVIKH